MTDVLNSSHWEKTLGSKFWSDLIDFDGDQQKELCFVGNSHEKQRFANNLVGPIGLSSTKGDGFKHSSSQYNYNTDLHNNHKKYMQAQSLEGNVVARNPIGSYKANNCIGSHKANHPTVSKELASINDQLYEKSTPSTRHMNNTTLVNAASLKSILKNNNSSTHSHKHRQNYTFEKQRKNVHYLTNNHNKHSSLNNITQLQQDSTQKQIPVEEYFNGSNQTEFYEDTYVESYDSNPTESNIDKSDKERLYIPPYKFNNMELESIANNLSFNMEFNTSKPDLNMEFNTSKHDLNMESIKNNNKKTSKHHQSTRSSSSWRG